MGFNRKVPIGRLDKIPPSNATNFLSHPFLVFETADVLDHGIGDDDVKRQVAIRHGASVADLLLHIWSVNLTLEMLVEDNHANLLVVTQAHALPELWRPADIEDADRPWQGTDQRSKEFETAPTVG